MAGIKAQIGYKRRPDSYGGKPSIVVDNTLARQFDVDAPDRAWVTDITYIRTQEGFAYLAMAIDLFSRRVLGDPEAVIVALDGRRDGLALLGLETGATSEWIGGHLVNDGSPVFAWKAGMFKRRWARRR
ncbi:hypothetical protein RHIZ404_190017 [Rhizobium sp. EC-SD404]|nr:hypothetical protein RHIZ404_190017 [Rhizobium sp. EC-SD404]